MKRMLILGLVFASACVPARHIDPGFALASVERPSDVAERWGDFELAPADSSGFMYEDDLLSLAVVPLSGTFSMVLENQSEYSIRFLWPEAAYVGATGFSSGVVSGSTRWIDMNEATPPQLIPSNSSASMILIPRANANTSNQTIEPFVPEETTCEEARGATARLVLPIEIQDVVNEYTLNFEATNPERVTRQMFGTTVQSVDREPCP